MSAEDIIASGKLEMYVNGTLPEDESMAVREAMQSYPEVKKEVELIEETYKTLGESLSPNIPAMVWSKIASTIGAVKRLPDTSSRPGWVAISGWAAAILCIGGILWMLKNTDELQKQLEVTTTENNSLKDEVTTSEGALAEANEILDILRSKDYVSITLPGNQAVAPEAFAKVYFNKDTQVAYIDAKGLPPAPEGKVYQVWSLIMEPLTPRSMGLLASGTAEADGVYKFENTPNPEAFGITLEPAGGSETPTLSALYTLGMVTP